MTTVILPTFRYFLFLFLCVCVCVCPVWVDWERRWLYCRGRGMRRGVKLRWRWRQGWGRRRDSTPCRRPRWRREEEEQEGERRWARGPVFLSTYFSLCSCWRRLVSCSSSWGKCSGRWSRPGRTTAERWRWAPLHLPPLTCHSLLSSFPTGEGAKGSRSAILTQVSGQIAPHTLIVQHRMLL